MGKRGTQAYTAPSAEIATAVVGALLQAGHDAEADGATIFTNAPGSFVRVAIATFHTLRAADRGKCTLQSPNP